MYPVLQELIHQAEAKYLKQDDLNNFQIEIARLKQRTVIYKSLRDQEIIIFQKIADQLIELFPDENSQTIETCLHHWILATRYSAMAMLLDNSEFLERRLLEWLTDIVVVHNYQPISRKIFTLLMSQLKKIFAEKELEILTPFMNQINSYLSDSKSLQV